MDKDFISDEDYLDSLLKKVVSNKEEGASEEELNTVADMAIEEMLKGSMEQTEEAEDRLSMDDLMQKEIEANGYQESADGVGFGIPDMDFGAEETTMAQLEAVEEDALTEPEIQRGEITGEDDGEDLLESLNSIVEEIRNEEAFSDTTESVFAGQASAEGLSEEDMIPEITFNSSDGFIGDENLLPEAESKTKKGKNKKEKNEKASLWSKIKNLLFTVEMVEDEEELSENQKVLKELEKEEKKKLKAEEKAKKLEEKKEADKLKQETDQQKKQLKEQKAAERKLEKEKKAAEKKKNREPEEQIKLKPVFIIFALTVIAVTVFSIILASDALHYQNNIKEASNAYVRQDYETAYQELSGMTLKENDQLLLDKLEILIAVDKKYNSYINFREINMPNEALDSLLKALNNYDRYEEQALSMGIGSEFGVLLENLSYALENEYRLTVEQARAINSIADTNEYTKQIHMYSNANTET